MSQAAPDAQNNNEVTAPPEAIDTLVPDGVDALIIELDGVIAQTALTHATAWKQAFDEFLAARSDGGSYRSFDSLNDYRELTDRASRLEGLRAVLESRGVTMQEGAPEDDPSAETLHGLDWFEVDEMRGKIQDGKVVQFQVVLKIGMKLD